MTLSQELINVLLQQRPASIAELAERLTPAVYATLQQAIELRRFADGTRLSEAQLEQCLQLVILYESKNVPVHLRTDHSIPTSCQQRQDSPAGQSESGVQIWGKGEA